MRKQVYYLQSPLTGSSHFDWSFNNLISLSLTILAIFTLAFSGKLNAHWWRSERNPAILSQSQSESVTRRNHKNPDEEDS